MLLCTRSSQGSLCCSGQRATRARDSVVAVVVTFAWCVLVVLVLYWAQAVLVPIALAILLTFLLAPPVTWLQRWVGRIPAVLAMVIFMLLERRALRDRLIGLIGHGQLAITTKAFDEAGTRVSRQLLMQSLVNLVYGIAAGVGLYFLGVPYPLVWAVFAAVIRFIPYLGPVLGAGAPILVSLAAADGWAGPLLVVGLFVVLELFTNLVLDATRELLSDAAESIRRLHPAPSAEPDDAAILGPREPLRVLGYATNGAADELALAMLAHLLDDLPISVEIVSTRMQASELLSLVQQQAFTVVCLADLPPSAPSKTRYLVKRLRAAVPDVKILVGRWAPAALADESTALLRETGANLVASTLLETRAYLSGLVEIPRIPVPETATVHAA